jgi:hypothetical protein
MPAEQEPRTTNPHALQHSAMRFSFVIRTQPAATVFNSPVPLDRGRFVGKRLNIELGRQVVNSGKKFSSVRQKNLSNPSFYRSFPRSRFCNHPSSEIKYTDLELA